MTVVTHKTVFEFCIKISHLSRRHVSKILKNISNVGYPYTVSDVRICCCTYISFDIRSFDSTVNWRYNSCSPLPGPYPFRLFRNLLFNYNNCSLYQEYANIKPKMSVPDLTDLILRTLKSFYTTPTKIWRNKSWFLSNIKKCCIYKNLLNRSTLQHF